MKAFFTLLMPLLLSFITNDTLDTCNGFEQFVFGTGKESYKNLILEIEESNAQLYSANENAIKISNVQFEYIRISFIRNKLSNIEMATKNTTSASFLKVLKARYGEPVKTQKNFVWSGKNVTIIYVPYLHSKDAIIGFCSKKIK